jgi:hypothetical protein
LFLNQSSQLYGQTLINWIPINNSCFDSPH